MNDSGAHIPPMPDDAPVRRRVIALGLVLALAAPAAAVAACPGVRPGALVETPVGFCSMNFAFKGRHGARYIGTAGHCILPERTGGEQVWKRGKGPAAKDDSGRVVGRFAYAVLELQGEKDFALIRLKKGVQADPSICSFGGPTGINREISGRTQTLSYYGQGTLLGNVVPARELIALGLPNPDHVFATGVVTPGDSGGPVIDSRKRAVGVLVSGGLLLGGIAIGEGPGGSDNGTVGVTRIGPQLDRAQGKLRTHLKLTTAPPR
jgi:hypothetical protein